MKFIVDANVVFALSKSSSVANNILSKYELKLLSPEFALVELYKYKSDLIKKSGIGSFSKIIESLKTKVTFIVNDEYDAFFKKVLLLIPDLKDSPYLALAFKFNCPIWSNDLHLKKQSVIPVFTTKELIKFLESSKQDLFSP